MIGISGLLSKNSSRIFMKKIRQLTARYIACFDFFFFKSNPQTASSVNREFSEIIIMGPAQEIAASLSWVWKWKSSSSVVAGARYKIRIYSSIEATFSSLYSTVFENCTKMSHFCAVYNFLFSIFFFFSWIWIFAPKMATIAVLKSKGYKGDFWRQNSKMRYFWRNSNRVHFYFAFKKSKVELSNKYLTLDT